MSSSSKYRIELEDFRPRMVRGHQSGNGAHCDAHPAKTGPPSHYLRVKGDSIQRFHAPYSNRDPVRIQLFICSTANKDSCANPIEPVGHRRVHAARCVALVSLNSQPSTNLAVCVPPPRFCTRPPAQAVKRRSRPPHPAWAFGSQPHVLVPAVTDGFLILGAERTEAAHEDRFLGGDYTVQAGHRGL